MLKRMKEGAITEKNLLKYLSCFRYFFCKDDSKCSVLILMKSNI